MTTRSRIRRVAVLIGTAALLVGFSPPAGAGETDVFGVTPHPPRVDGEERRALNVPAEEGTVTDAVRVYNRTDEPIRLAVYAAPVRRQDDGVLAVGFRGQDTSGPAAGITPEREDLRLDAGADAVVPVRIRVPDEIPSSHLGAVVVEQREAGPGEQTGFDLVQRVAILVRAATPGDPVAATPAQEGSTGTLPWAVGLVVAAGLLAALSRRRNSDEPANEVPDEDAAGEIHERVHAAPPAP